MALDGNGTHSINVVLHVKLHKLSFPMLGRSMVGSNRLKSAMFNGSEKAQQPKNVGANRSKRSESAPIFSAQWEPGFIERR